VGAVPSGEGVHGMRPALVLAGAESQVVSLWSVSDASTRELMREFYGELARGTGRAQAQRQAKLRLLRQPRFAHPYYWAAFIPQETGLHSIDTSLNEGRTTNDSAH
jgi:CHAT domain-containing protein